MTNLKQPPGAGLERLDLNLASECRNYSWPPLRRISRTLLAYLELRPSS